MEIEEMRAGLKIAEKRISQRFSNPCIYKHIKKEQFLKPGFIYFILSKNKEMIKIGWAICPEERLKTLQTGSASRLELIGTIKGTIKDEKSMHKRMKDLHIKDEWFLADGNLIQFIRERNGT